MTARVTSPRRLRAHRAAQRWAETADLQGVPLPTIETAVADAADLVERDLALDEVDRVAAHAVVVGARDLEQQRADEAKRTADEEQRAAYLARRRADILRDRDDKEGQ